MEIIREQRGYLGLVQAAAMASFIVLTGCSSSSSSHITPEPGAAGSGTRFSTDIIAPKGLPPSAPVSLVPTERRITILSTNDIHGGLEPSLNSTGQLVGGMATLGGAVRAIRQGVQSTLGEQGGVLLVDAGDQFQGTLVSNYNEGSLAFATMDRIGYDAVVPGNHAYDFGPQGWLVDQVGPGSADLDPRGSLKKIAKEVKFPLLSANTYTKASLVDANGNPVPVDGTECAPLDPHAPAIDWTKAQRPDFLTPYVIKQVAGLRVALIGIDNVTTPTMTTIQNVSDLCFRDERDTYLELREALGRADRADVYVIVIHNGQNGVVRFISWISLLGQDVVHAVIAGHTHTIDNNRVNGIPIIQSGTGGQLFGRVDLVWDTVKKTVVPEKLRVGAGLRLVKDTCANRSEWFCTPADATHAVSYDGKQVQDDPNVAEIIAQGRAEVDVLAKKRVGHAAATVKRDRILESPLANVLTDGLLQASGNVAGLNSTSQVEVSFMNSGGIRADLNPGEVTYEDIFKILPFGNRGVVVGPMPASRLIELLHRSAQSCGNYGALMQSGLKVEFERDCAHRQIDQIDAQTVITKVTTAAGDVILDVANGIQPAPDRQFYVTTLDFLAAGGSGYTGFMGVPKIQDLGIAREIIIDQWLAHPQEFSSQVDNRWVSHLPAVAPAPTPAPAPSPNPSPTPSPTTVVGP